MFPTFFCSSRAVRQAFVTPARGNRKVVVATNLAEASAARKPRPLGARGTGSLGGLTLGLHGPKEVKRKKTDASGNKQEEERWFFRVIALSARHVSSWKNIG